MRALHPLRLLLLALSLTAGLIAFPLLILATTTPAADSLWTDFTPAVGQWTNVIPATAAVSASDTDGLSADIAYQYRISSNSDWSGWQTAHLQSTSTISSSRRITVTQLPLTDGLNFIQFRITDTLGSVGNSPAFPISLDTAAPAAPIALLADPASWTTTNAFALSWSNPADPAGIAGAWYKLDTAPQNDDDGVWVPGAALDQITGIAVDGDGAHSVWLWLSDSAGNSDYHNAATQTLPLDTTPPPALQNATVVPSTWTNNNQFDLSWQAPADPSGISGVRALLDTRPQQASDGEFWAGATDGLSGYSLPNAAEGAHELWLWPVDGAGNAASPADAISLILKLDLTPPGPPLSVPNVTPHGWQTATAAAFTVTWTNPTDTSGIAAACYKLGTEPATDLDGTCIIGANIDRISPIQPANPGSYHLFLWLQDNAGNIDKNSRRVALDAVQWDPIPPELTIDPQGDLGANGWFTSPITVQITATDTGSGLERSEYSLDDAAWRSGDQVQINTDGVHLLSVRAYDVAGNHTAAGPQSLSLDTQPPTTDLALSATPIVDDWYDDAVTIILTPRDATSGPDATYWRLNNAPWQRGNTIVVSSEGPHTLSYYAVDLAGLRQNPQSLPIHIDRQPPVTSYAILPSDGVDGWYTQAVTVTLFPADEGIGVADTLYRINGAAWQHGTTFALSESGEYSVEFYSVDALGHAEDPYLIPNGIHIDTEAPRSPTPIDIAPRGWSNDNQFDLTLAIPPDLSGISGLYYKIGAAPQNATDGTWRPGGGSILRQIQAPAEGRFSAYVWLQDGAGNVDATHVGVWEDALALHYDATPPTTAVQLQGQRGRDDWFTSAVTVTLVATDTLSGVANTTASIDGSPTVTTTQFTLSSADKHTLLFHSADHAGNSEIPQLATIRIDPDPPASPQAVSLSPQGWSQTNSFSLSWINPPDLSGIAAGYVKLGAPPISSTDGIPLPPMGTSTLITAPNEGAWDVHFWLMDHAGNADLGTGVVLPAAIRFDGTPPLTTSTLVAGRQSPSGWYITPVSVQLRATDTASGVDVLRYRIDGGEWVESSASALIQLDTSGRHVLEFQSQDIAGNLEALHSRSYLVDLHPPLPAFEPIERYQRQSSFAIAWHAYDEADGSGVDGFDVQVKDGRNGAWTIWGAANVPDTGARYYGNFGHRYFFRLRARDRAGNTSAWQELAGGIYIDRLLDGDFAGSNFGEWQHDGALAQTIILAPGPSGQTVPVAQLGTPAYGPNVPGQDIPGDSNGTVPVGAATISQTLLLPGADVLDQPVLTFWYRLFTYDTEYSEVQSRWYDTLDVRLNGPSGEILALRDGLPYQQWQEGVLADLGWRQAFIPIPRTWLGETITIRIQNWNRVDGRLNTWSHVTDVRLWDPYRLYLPALQGGAPGRAQNSSEPVLRHQPTSSSLR